MKELKTLLSMNLCLILLLGLVSPITARAEEIEETEAISISEATESVGISEIMAEQESEEISEPELLAETDDAPEGYTGFWPPDDVMLMVGETFNMDEIEIANLPDGVTESDLIWSVNSYAIVGDEEVVTLSNGIVTAVSTGSASVVAEYYDKWNPMLYTQFGYLEFIVPELSGTCGAGVGDDLSWEIDRMTKTLTISGNGAIADYIVGWNDDGDYNSAPWFPYFEGLNRHSSNPTEFELVLENGVTSIGDYAFGCEFIGQSMVFSDIKLPGTLIHIGDSAFNGATFKNNVLPVGLKSIGTYAFGWSEFKDSAVYIPASVGSIGDGAFTNWYGERSLESAYFFGDAPKEFGEDVFGSAEGFTVYYVEGTSGWTDSEAYDAEAGTWNGYKLTMWDGLQEDGNTEAGLQLGDFITYGTYNDHPMLWQVVDIDDGKLKIFSTDILFNGPIDAEINMSGNASLMEGNTNWHTSDIRQYLNSNDRTVLYKDVLPNYGSLPGFLTNFTEDELALLQDTTHKSLVHYNTSGVEKDGGTKYARDTFFNRTDFDLTTYEDLAYVNTTEKVFLPDMMDLREINEKGLSTTRYAYSEYTDSFVETASSGFFTRTPVYSIINAFSTTYYYGVYYVHTWFGTSTAEAKRGIRPMCYIQLNTEHEFTGDGTLESPYALSFGSGDVDNSNELQIVSRSPENGSTVVGGKLIISMTFNREIESVQTGISFDENNHTVLHGDFGIVRQIEEADGWEFETVYSLSGGDHAETDVSVDGNTLRIRISETQLILGETYYVYMDPGVITFKDTDERIGFGGTEWIFTVSGAKTGTFRYKAQYGITEYPYAYDDSWFLESSTKYNHDLAKMSLRTAIAAYGSGSNADGSEYIQDLMNDELGFHNLEVYYPEPQRNSIGYAIGSKTIPSNDSEHSTQSLILVAIRGGEYGIEWGGNLTIGTGELSDGIAGDLHEGFLRAAEQVEDGLASYIRWNREKGNLEENCVVWVVGYSRAAATANLLAKRLDDGNITGLGTNNVFAYCFECPQNSRASNLSNDKYDNIMNIVNPLDFVTMVAMDDWNYGRYGQTFYLPYEEGVENYNSLKYKMLQQYISIIQAGSTGGNAFEAVEQVKGQRDMTEGAMNWLADEFGSPELYTVLYQEALVECIEAFITKEWKPVSNTASAIVVLGKLGLIVKDAVSLPDKPYDLVDKISGMEDDMNALMALELMLFSASDRGGLTKTPITYSHYPELCLAWMDSLEGDEIVHIDDKYRKVFINCPVDVSVYNSNDVLVGRVVDGTIQDLESCVSIYIDSDDQIVISLPITEEYRIDMEATGEGTVSYLITEHNIETKSSERVVSYPLIEVKEGDLLEGTIENLDEATVVEYNLIHNGDEQVAEIDQCGDDVDAYFVTCAIDGNGVVSGGGKSLYGEYRKIVATPDEGAEFIGWYIDNTLISSEAEYRFCVLDDVTITAKFSSDDPSTSNEPLTRGLICELLVERLKLSTILPDESPFADVAETDERYSAIMACYDLGIISGYSDGNFCPDDTLNRGQLAKILYNADCGTGNLYDEPDILPADMSPNSAFYSFACNMLAAGVMSLDEERLFRPYDYAVVKDVNWKTVETSMDLLTLNTNGGAWSDQTAVERAVRVQNTGLTELAPYSELLANEGHTLTGWCDEMVSVEYPIDGKVVSAADLTLFAVWEADGLVIDGTSYAMDKSHKGNGWSYSPAHDGVDALLVLGDYQGGCIYSTNNLRISAMGENYISASVKNAAIKTEGSLQLEVLDGKTTIQGGNGEHAIYGKQGIQIVNDSELVIIGGIGGAAVSTEGNLKIDNNGAFSAVGGTSSNALQSDAQIIVTGAGRDTFVSGTALYPSISGANLILDENLKFYGGNNADEAVRCEVNTAYPYIRIQPKAITLILDANGGLLKGQSVYEYDVAQNAENLIVFQPEEIPVRSGYRFLGWNAQTDGSGTEYVCGEKYSFSERTDFLRLYAQWEEVEYTVQVIGTEIQIVLTDAVEEKVQLILTAYEQGKMLNVTYGKKTADQTWRFSVNDIPENAEWKLIYVNSDYQPVRKWLEIELT